MFLRGCSCPAAQVFHQHQVRGLFTRSLADESRRLEEADTGDTEASPELDAPIQHTRRAGIFETLPVRVISNT